MFHFQEGETVAVKANYPSLGLRAGDTGTVWALYQSEPPAYEVTFRDRDGREFDMTVYEEEIERPGAPRGAGTEVGRGTGSGAED